MVFCFDFCLKRTFPLYQLLLVDHAIYTGAIFQLSRANQFCMIFAAILYIFSDFCVIEVDWNQFAWIQEWDLQWWKRLRTYYWNHLKWQCEKVLKFKWIVILLCYCRRVSMKSKKWNRADDFDPLYWFVFYWPCPVSLDSVTFVRIR